MMVPSIREPTNALTSNGNNDDADMCLSELTENSLMISSTHEVTKFNSNNSFLTNPTKGGLYSNDLFNTTTPHEECRSNESSPVIEKMVVAPGPIGASSALAMPQSGVVDPDVGLLGESFPECWNDWESKRRSDSMKNYHTKQLRTLKRIRKRKTVVGFRRRRLRLERSGGRHLRDSCMKRPVVLPTVPESESECSREIVPFQASKSLRRRQRRRVVRFRDEEIAEGTLEWKREKNQPKGASFGRGLGGAFGTEAPFLEAERERKQSQRALMDLQVGMTHMGL
jgi:hypothetical protein